MGIRRYIVRGQRVDEAKVERAHQLRREMTSEEEVLWQALRTNHFHSVHFRRQQVIDGFIVDFYCHAAGLVIEVDGPIHNMQTGYDEARDRVLKARDLRVLRFSNGDVRQNLAAVLERIQAEVNETV